MEVILSDCAPPHPRPGVASPLPVDVGIALGGFQCHSVDGGSAASCDFGAFGGEDEHTSFSPPSFFDLSRNEKNSYHPCF